MYYNLLDICTWNPSLKTSYANKRLEKIIRTKVHFYLRRSYGCYVIMPATLTFGNKRILSACGMAHAQPVLFNDLFIRNLCFIRLINKFTVSIVYVLLQVLFWPIKMINNVGFNNILHFSDVIRKQNSLSVIIICIYYHIHVNLHCNISHM